MAANQERTYLMIKPDGNFPLWFKLKFVYIFNFASNKGVQRGLVGEIVKRFEQKGFKLVAMKFVQVMSF